MVHEMQLAFLSVLAQGSHMYCLGIDAGSTKTRAAVADASGVVVAEASAGSCNFVVHGKEAALREMQSLLNQLRQTLGVKRETLEFRAVFMGSAGIAREAEFSIAEEMLRSIEYVSMDTVLVENDVQLALSGGLLDAPGIALISGTGSNCIGRAADGSMASAGGMEWLVDDRGSGFQIGLQGLKLAARTLDGRAQPTDWTQEILRSLGIDSVADVIPRLHGAGDSGSLISKREVAALAPIVLRAAGSGDGGASRILRAEADELALMFLAVAQRLACRPSAPLSWTITSSVGNHSAFLPSIDAAIQSLWPSATFRPQILSPERAALLLAAKAANHQNLAEFISNLSKTL